MNKTEITKAIADKSGLTLKDSEKFLKSFTEVVEKALSKGDDVVLIGFGTFSRVKHGARIARNLQTGKTIQVPPSKTVKFRVGKNLKESVNRKQTRLLALSNVSSILA
ncbi:MAG: HU family DNA-binding protein [Holosporaceae bacterium]|jgi:DNA-binding protein HU-beta|nr:HU family DNA-binding protein [Holosporaceae bacterium]